MINDYISKVKANGSFDVRRNHQQRYWLYESLEEHIKQRFYNTMGMDDVLKKYEQMLLSGKITSFAAASKVLEYYNYNKSGER